MASSFPEPSPRFVHYSAAIGGQLYVWGGRTKDFSTEKRELSVSVHSFDQYLETWKTRTTTGKHPPGLHHGACTSSGHHLYLYGGYDGSLRHNSLYQLDTDSLEWSQLPSGPTRKIGCGMVSYEDKLIVFGGYGIRSGPTQPGSEFTKDNRFSDGCGWTNEQHVFDVKKGEWFSPTITGTRPPPCSDFSFNKVDHHHAVLFGGYQSTHGYSNDVYVLNLKKMHWSVQNKDKKPWPSGRDNHATVCLWNGGGHPQLLVTGGSDKNRKVLSDAWILDLQARRWRKVDVPDFKGRCMHTATAFNLCPGVIEVTLFGGCREWGNPQIANTTVLKFEYQNHPSIPGPSTGEWVLTDMADNTQLGTRQRIETKAAKKPGHADSGTGHATNYQEAERRVQEAEERCREVERRLRVAEGRVAEAERGKAVSEESLRECEEKLQQLETQWVVERREIQLIGPELGKGGWATVSIATFRGVRVAAKCIHNQVITDYNIHLFKREMNMAARIRHPNLLQFIGATQRGELIILTELMPTSLRRELESRQGRQLMSLEQVISIGVDVARALNYLHLMQPHPLIHHDISSANVLLQPLPNNSWRAKVADYGIVNLLQSLETVHSGNNEYTAPEANDPTKQSPKMDIFSFGVLLVEMLTGEFPDSTNRARQLRKISHQSLLTLVQKCLSRDRDNRPSASDIITELDS